MSSPDLEAPPPPPPPPSEEGIVGTILTVIFVPLFYLLGLEYLGYWGGVAGVPVGIITAVYIGIRFGTVIFWLMFISFIGFAIYLIGYWLWLGYENYLEENASTKTTELNQVEMGIETYNESAKDEVYTDEDAPTSIHKYQDWAYVNLTDYSGLTFVPSNGRDAVYIADNTTQRHAIHIPNATSCVDNYVAWFETKNTKETLITHCHELGNKGVTYSVGANPQIVQAMVAGSTMKVGLLKRENRWARVRVGYEFSLMGFTASKESELFNASQTMNKQLPHEWDSLEHEYVMYFINDHIRELPPVIAAAFASD